MTIAAVVIGGAIAALTTWTFGKVETRRRHQLDYLIETYYALQNASARSLSPKYAHELEAALDRVFLFGSREQLALAAEFRTRFAADGNASLDALLLSLRRRVRKELALPDDGARGVPFIRVNANRPGDRR